MNSECPEKMKYQQISVNISQMFYSAGSYLLLAAAVWVLLKLIQACFWLPNTLKKQRTEMDRMIKMLPKEYQDMAEEIKEELEREKNKKDEADSDSENKKVK